MPNRYAEVDNLKVAGEYHAAGKLAFEIGYGRNYGCHFGMRSTRNYAITEFEAGYDQAETEGTKNAD